MLYDQVKKLCFERRISPSALAKQLNLSTSAPRRWKEGSLPKTETLQKIADYFGVTTDYLLYGEDHAQNTVINATNSAFAHGVSGGNVSISNIVGLQGNEAELLRVFRGLDIRGQTAVLMTAYAEEERQGKK